MSYKPLTLEHAAKLLGNQTLDSCRASLGAVVVSFGAEYYIDGDRQIQYGVVQLSFDSTNWYIDSTRGCPSRHSFVAFADAYARAVSFLRRAGCVEKV